MKRGGRVHFVGVSPQIRELQAEAERVARSDAKVLITGESGVGKEILAHSIHAASPRVAAPFVPVNCAGIPETLLESELFGHVKGSFTGAYRDKPGKLECANNGTIFLDEMAEMTLRMQGMLLRFLETGEIQKVGADRVAMVTNVRVIAATNRNLRDLIAQGQFREDLFYRLNVVHLTIPPLRERRVDIPPLIEEFLRVFSSRHHEGNGNGDGYVDGAAHEGGGISRAMSPEALAALCCYSWPGNVRQLENVIERLVVTGRREVIQIEDLPPEVRLPAPYGVRPRRDRRRSIADELFARLVKEGESFWTAVYPLYMNREITRGNVRDLVRKGLEEARGNYTIVLRMFNMQPRDYKRFLNFLRKHGCRLSFKEYR